MASGAEIRDVFLRMVVEEWDSCIGVTSISRIYDSSSGYTTWNSEDTCNARILWTSLLVKPLISPLTMGAITPFIVLLIVALIFNYIPMEGQLKRIGYIIIGIVAIVMLLRLAGIL